MRQSSSRQPCDSIRLPRGTAALQSAINRPGNTIGDSPRDLTIGPADLLGPQCAGRSEQQVRRVAFCDSVDQINSFWDSADWLGGYRDWRRHGHLTAVPEYN